MKYLALPTTLLAILLFNTNGYAADSYQVVFETMDCSGNSGFATVRPDDIYKVVNGDCSDPENPGKKLKQLLVHDGTGSYTAHSLTQDEARAVMKDLKEYMRSQKGLLDRSNSIILSR